MRRAAATVLAAVLATAACQDGSAPNGLSPAGTAARSGPAGTAGATVRVRVAGDVAAAAPVLRARLAALGLAPGEPAIEGPTVTFAVARAATPAEVEGLARPGRLAFRPVVGTLDPAAPVSGAPPGSCTDDRHVDVVAAKAADPGASRVVACAADGTAKYDLGPVADTGPVVSAGAEGQQQPVDTGMWQVTVQFADESAWAAVTRRLTGERLAIVLDGVVQSAPTVEIEMPMGVAVISGDFTEDQATALAAAIGSGVLDAEVEITVR